MRVFTTSASHEVQHVGSLSSFYQIETREGDERAIEWKTRGDVARERFVEHFLKDDKYSPEDAILLTDADQRHPPDLLEKLRTSAETNGLDMVCAHYYRRETKPIQSLCYELGDGTFPFFPYLDPPTEGLHEIAVTGFGCVLIRKKVLQKLASVLPKGMSPISIGPLPEIADDHGNWGPDFRFFYRARTLGFRLWLDASVESLHAVTLWLGHKSARKLIDYQAWASAAQEALEGRLELHGVTTEAFKQRLRILTARFQSFEQEAQKYAGRERGAEEEQAYMELSVAIYEMTGRIKEMNAWIEMNEKHPQIVRPQQLPTTANTPPQGLLTENEVNERFDAYRENAIDFVKELPDVPASN